MDELQNAVGEWAEATYPEASQASMLEHLKREVSDLEAAVSPEHVAEEAADALLILLHLAHRNGFSLESAAWTKFGIAQVRGQTRAKSRRPAAYAGDARRPRHRPD